MSEEEISKAYYVMARIEEKVEKLQSINYHSHLNGKCLSGVNRQHLTQALFDCWLAGEGVPE